MSTLERELKRANERRWYRARRTSSRPFTPRWTAAEVDRVRAYYAAHRTLPLHLDQLAVEMGRSIVALSLKASRLGLGNFHRPKVAVRKVRQRMFESAELRRSVMSARRREWLRTHPHPRGMLGKKHTEATKSVVSMKSRASWQDPASGRRSAEASQRRSDVLHQRLLKGGMRTRYTRSAGGRRSDLDDRYFRSRWEANYARYLTLIQAKGHIAAWEYEPKTFVFEKISRGTRAYTPDFRVTYPDGRYEWHEVKGWMDQPSRTRLARMKRYFPDEKLVLIDKAWFDQARRSGLAGVIPGWERRI